MGDYSAYPGAVVIQVGEEAVLLVMVTQLVKDIDLSFFRL